MAVEGYDVTDFEGLIEAQTHQGTFGEHLTQLIVTSAGYACSKPLDFGDGVDLTISRTHPKGVVSRPPNVELQVKSSRVLQAVGSSWSLDLKVHDYDCLRAPGASPRYLIVVDIRSAECDSWVGYGHDFTVFHRGVYWVSLRGAPATDNSEKIAVHIPKVNRLTQQVVKQMMREAREDFEARFMRESS